MARQTFMLPDLGEGLTEAELVNWLVGVGDEIRVDQPIAEVETAKSMVEVPSPFAGTVAELHGKAGDTIDVGKPLISVEAGERSAAGEHPAAAAYRQEERAGAEPAAAAEPAPEVAAESGSGNVLIGYGTRGGHGTAKRTRRPRARAAGAARREAAGMADAEHGRATNAGAGAPDPGARAEVPAPLGLAERPAAPGQAPLVISPLVRKLARDAGLRLADIDGSGAGGLVLRRDVEAALAGGLSRPAAGAAPEFPAAAQVPETAAGAPELDPRSGLAIAERTPMRGVRKTVAAAMARSRREIPEATVWVDVDATALLELRAALKRKDPDGAPGLLAFIGRFVTAGLRKYPELNSRVEGEDIVRFDGVNLGFAAQTDRGLMVPSVRDAGKLSARSLDAEIRRLTAVARSGKATPEELTRGTFTLNNYGVFGVDGSAAIINYPEVAILGVGRIIERPWVVDGVLAVRSVTELTLSFDHRVCDGATAGGFLRFVADAIENPAGILAEL
ncbi:dihydrolipoamide acetyltransferase family protein [Arthrobacter crystallopoietes]|uniref:dihydrolipoamide acetyltransferase family protein n=1 Tax=Crystallibacter crystallopoietes TaxID=37928 RepID=UPI003D1AB9FE